MCLLALAWQSHTRYPLLFAGNRDEFHARPAAAAAWWPDRDGWFGGRDLQGGGTWLAATRRGRFAVVTNFREPALESADERPSRGGLVTGFLTSRDPARDHAAMLADNGSDYAGFNLLLADRAGLHYVSNRAESRLDLPPGVYALSNSVLDTPWPKVERLRAGFQHLLEGEPGDGDLLALLADRRTADDEELPDTGIGAELERLLSAAFIVSPVYGTRCSSVVGIGQDGRTRFTERRFGPDGTVTGEITETWHNEVSDE